MTNVNDNKRVLERYVAAMQAGDEQAVRDCFAEDATWTLHAGELPMSGTWAGRDRITDGFFAPSVTVASSPSGSTWTRCTRVRRPPGRRVGAVP